MHKNQDFTCNSPESKDLLATSRQTADSKRLTGGEGQGGTVHPVIPSCWHTKRDGMRCGSPALRGKRFCYFHARPPRKPKVLPPELPDPCNTSAVLAFTIHGLMSGTLDRKAAGQIIYLTQQLMK
jgi:hypothetical protein